MKKTILAIIALCATYAGISAPPETNIIPISSFNEVKERLAQCNENTLVLFGINETLINPDTSLRDAYHHNDSIHRKTHEMFPELNVPVVYNFFSKHLSSPRLMEPNIPTIIQALKNTNTTVLGLTARKGQDQHMETLSKQLENLNIRFSPKFEDASFDKGGTLYNGILFCSEHSKGAVLEEFLSDKNHPKHILFFDDQECHLESIVQYCDVQQIPITPYLYKGRTPPNLDDDRTLERLMKPIVAKALMVGFGTRSQQRK